MTEQALSHRRGSRIFIPDIHQWFTVENVSHPYTYVTDCFNNTFRVPTHELLKMAR